MNAYRRLHAEELEELRDQFIRFLVLHGIPADLWEDIKAQDPTKAEDLLDQFSQQVFASVLSQIRYMEQREARSLIAYRCTEEQIEMRALLVEGGTGIDFRQNQSADAMIREVSKHPDAKLRIAQGERAYQPNRDEELFRMLESNVRIANSSELFDTFDKLIRDQNG